VCGEIFASNQVLEYRIFQSRRDLPDTAEIQRRGDAPRLNISGPFYSPRHAPARGRKNFKSHIALRGIFSTSESKFMTQFLK